MSNKKERQAECFADDAESIIKDVFLNDLTIGEIADELKTHPILAELTSNELRNVNLFLCLGALKFAVNSAIEKRDNEAAQATGLYFFSPKEITEKVNVSMDVVLRWIRNGDLKASNVSNQSGRIRWRIAAHDLAEFMEQRAKQAIKDVKKIRNNEPDRR